MARHGSDDDQRNDQPSPFRQGYMGGNRSAGQRYSYDRSSSSEGGRRLRRPSSTEPYPSGTPFRSGTNGVNPPHRSAPRNDSSTPRAKRIDSSALYPGAPGNHQPGNRQLGNPQRSENGAVGGQRPAGRRSGSQPPHSGTIYKVSSPGSSAGSSSAPSSSTSSRQPGESGKRAKKIDLSQAGMGDANHNGRDANRANCEVNRNGRDNNRANMGAGMAAGANRAEHNDNDVSAYHQYKVEKKARVQEEKAARQEERAQRRADRKSKDQDRRSAQNAALASAWSQVQDKGATLKESFGRTSDGRITPKRIAIDLLKWLGILLLLGFVLGVLFFVLMYIFARVPAPGEVPTAQRVTIVANDNETILGTIIPPEGNRREVTSEQIPQHLKYAAMSAEDRDFETNKGFSITGFGRAALGQLRGDPGAGGGSTITQQYVKNALVGNKRSYWRKFKELVLSMKMANQWDKDQIITAYLNTIYFGRGAYGVQTASQAYFNKDVKDLTPSESALLAGIIQQPSNLDPSLNKTGAVDRWKYVVNGMYAKNWLTRDEVSQMSFPKTQKPEDSTVVDDSFSGPNGLLKNQIMNELREHGIEEQDITSEGLRIVTTISAKAQQALLDQMKATLEGQPKEMRSAAVSVDPSTGGILAYYGGTIGSGFDYANSAQMTGSSFKVFGLAAGLEQDIPLSKVYDSSPVTVGSVTINNSEGASCGSCSIARATVLSLNTSFYRLMMDLKNGSNDVADMAHRAGIPRELPGVGKTLQNPDGVVEGGVILGQYPVRPLDMAVAYATFASRGMYHEPYFVESAVSDNGNGAVVYRHEKKNGEKRIEEKIADNISSALMPIAAHSNNHGLSGGRPSAAKTGTVQLGDTGKNRDAWMVGYTPQVSTAVWFGTQNGTALETSTGAAVWGATLPSDVWQATMNGAHEDLPIENFPAPEAIGGQAGAPVEYDQKPSSSSKDEDDDKDDREDGRLPDIDISRPTLPGLPGIENPFAPPTTTTRPREDRGGLFDSDGILWR